MFFGTAPSKTLPPAMPKKPKVYCCDCKHNGVFSDTEFNTLSDINEMQCRLPHSDGSWFSPNFPFKYQAMSDKNIHNDCPDFETIFIKYTPAV